MAALISIVLTALKFILLADVVLSWVRPNPEEFPRNITSAIADPLCAPIRKILNPQRMGGLDLSALVVFFLLNYMSRKLAGSL